LYGPTIAISSEKFNEILYTAITCAIENKLIMFSFC
jgi:hypothetical protein